MEKKIFLLKLKIKKKKKKKLLAIEHKNTHNEKDFQDYFEKYKDISIKKRITDKDVQNMDKMRFYLSCNRVY